MQLNPQDKVVFYPCCATDIKFPIELLGKEGKHFVFCDIRRHSNWPRQSTYVANASYFKSDAREILKELPRVDILFYRRDGMGEGGSELEILGNEYLKALFEKFPESGGLIITDGSNLCDRRFKQLLSGQVHIDRFSLKYDPNMKLHEDLHTIKVC